jgi:RHS repeat-associated protein
MLRTNRYAKGWPMARLRAAPDATYSYDAWGTQTAQGTFNTRYAFTGRELADAGLMYYRARQYDPGTGRFLHEDSVRFDESSNFYVYAANSPSLNTDPSGHHSIYFDGGFLRIFDDSGKLLLKCRAFSGRSGTTPKDQGIKWMGPIPSGIYFLDPTEFTGGAGTFATARRNVFSDWGTWRVPLHPYPGTNVRGRDKDSFFLHGGKSPGSGGCIDVQDCDKKVHNLLKDHPGPVRIDVNYSGFIPF